MLTLAIETSNQVLSIALCEDGQLIGEMTSWTKQQHSERLLPAIDQLFKETQVDKTSVQAIAVANGPGSYTGLRMAVTAAKSLALAWDCQLIPVSSLAVLASNVMESHKTIIPVMDARRSNVYAGFYRRHKEGLKSLAPEKHIDAEKLAYELKAQGEEVLLVGDLSSELKGIFEGSLADLVSFAPNYLTHPRAELLAHLAQDEASIPAHLLTPNYLKLAEAEENWLAENPGRIGENYIEKT